MGGGHGGGPGGLRRGRGRARPALDGGALRAGARGYLLKDADRDETPRRIRRPGPVAAAVRAGVRPQFVSSPSGMVERLSQWVSDGTLWSNTWITVEEIVLGFLLGAGAGALSFFQPIGQQAEATGVGRIYISPARGDVPQLTGATHGVLFTTQDVIDSKSKALSAFLRAIAKAEKTITDDPTKAKQLLQKYQATMNPATVTALVPILQKEIPKDPNPTADGYQKSAAFHKESGLVTSPPSFADMVPSSFISAALKGGN